VHARPAIAAHVFKLARRQLKCAQDARFLVAALDCLAAVLREFAEFGGYAVRAAVVRKAIAAAVAAAHGAGPPARALTVSALETLSAVAVAHFAPWAEDGALAAVEGPMLAAMQFADETVTTHFVRFWAAFARMYGAAAISAGADPLYKVLADIIASGDFSDVRRMEEYAPQLAALRCLVRIARADPEGVAAVVSAEYERLAEAQTAAEDNEAMVIAAMGMLQLLTLIDAAGEVTPAIDEFVLSKIPNVVELAGVECVNVRASAVSVLSAIQELMTLCFALFQAADEAVLRHAIALFEVLLAAAATAPAFLMENHAAIFGVIRELQHCPSVVGNPNLMYDTYALTGALAALLAEVHQEWLAALGGEALAMNAASLALADLLKAARGVAADAFAPLMEAFLPALEAEMSEFLAFVLIQLMAAAGPGEAVVFAEVVVDLLARAVAGGSRELIMAMLSVVTNMFRTCGASALDFAAPTAALVVELISDALLEVRAQGLALLAEALSYLPAEAWEVEFNGDME
jgi:hypothetical protein